jgi:hypothetical protein
MTATELKKFFKENEDEIKSKYSNADRKSLVSSYKAKLMSKLANQNAAAEDEGGEAAEEVKSPRNEAVKDPEDVPEESQINVDEIKEEVFAKTVGFEKNDDVEELTVDDDVTLESSHKNED